MIGQRRWDSEAERDRPGRSAGRRNGRAEISSDLRLRCALRCTLRARQGADDLVGGAGGCRWRARPSWAGEFGAREWEGMNGRRAGRAVRATAESLRGTTLLPTGLFLRCPAGARSHSARIPGAASAGADLPPANFLRRPSGTGSGRPRTRDGASDSAHRSTNVAAATGDRSRPVSLHAPALFASLCVLCGNSRAVTSHCVCRLSPSPFPMRRWACRAAPDARREIGRVRRGAAWRQRRHRLRATRA